MENPSRFNRFDESRLEVILVDNNEYDLPKVLVAKIPPECFADKNIILRSSAAFPIMLNHWRGYSLKNSIFTRCARSAGLDLEDFTKHLCEDIKFYQLPKLGLELDHLIQENYIELSHLVGAYSRPIEEQLREDEESFDEFSAVSKQFIGAALMSTVRVYAPTLDTMEFHHKIATLLREEKGFIRQLYQYWKRARKYPAMQFLYRFFSSAAVFHRMERMKEQHPMPLYTKEEMDAAFSEMEKENEKENPALNIPEEDLDEYIESHSSTVPEEK
jgi:hypothetical protein